MDFDLILVDDDPAYLQLHEVLVKKSGFHNQPILIDSGKKAIEYLEQEVDSDRTILLFLDIYMKDIDGWDVLDFIESYGLPEKIKVMLVSSSVDLSDKRKALKYNTVIEYIEKPLVLPYLERLKELAIF
ncbi:response regulator [Algoriphagus sp. CAU 1675]|uniref:response regulator n=1 Tax=Algoriphagus sp. CAU 1675 TaxID=3032597 RepID=UPI0023DCC3CC|nr:response regulator [Algoriphagus sp. CAU 1675]MDF2157335.1 response regulator [Algoriphagus sp. CAU 1675]